MDIVHHFYVAHAIKYGVEEAILLHDIIYWIRKNAANGKHFHDGRFWTYNSAAAFAELHPYWRDKNGRTDKIQRIINSLVKQGAILKGNYNQIAYDRTLWYALSDELADCIFQNSEIENANLRNGYSEIAEAIPNNNTDNNTYKESIRGNAPRFTPPTLEEVEAYCIERRNRINPQHFIDFYSANGWMVGKNKMKDWRAAVRTWETRENDKRNGSRSNDPGSPVNYRQSGGPTSRYPEDTI